MTKTQLTDKYFYWMYSLVCSEQCNKKASYNKLLHRLHDISFNYTLPMDGNRAEDGINLRYRFGDEQNYPEAMIASYLDDRSCSVLEMMIALVLRFEEHIMDDPDIGDRTGVWFWDMIESLGLEAMDDRHFDKVYVDETIDIFLNREYEPNGHGGLFTVNHPKRDMRHVDIWYQMCWYLDEILND